MSINAKLDDLLVHAQAEVSAIDRFAPPAPNEDCPICFLPYPHQECLSVYSSCCGKLICGGCMFKQLVLLAGNNEKIGGPKDVCAFCRQTVPNGDDNIKAIQNQMQNQNPHAFLRMADCYKTGDHVPQSNRKALEMFIEAAKLGQAEGYMWIARYYREGLVVAESRTKARAFFEIAAKIGSALGHKFLAELEDEDGNVDLAMQHYKIAANAGLQQSLNALKEAFRDKCLSKTELEQCLRAFQAANDEMKSEDRDNNLAYMVMMKREKNQL